MYSHFRKLIFALVLFALPAFASAAENAYLRNKADEHMVNLTANHRPGMGGIVQVVWEDTGYEDVLFYMGQGDSTMWTSVYLAAECYRYQVTGDPQAQANAISAIETLHNHIAVTQTPGYLGRYVGPIEQPYIFDYLTNPILRYGEGDWEGYFWLGNGSSDQHVGFFFGMSIAYDLIDDEDARDMIRADVRAVYEHLRDHNWLITDERGLPTTAAPGLNGSERMAILLACANILEDPDVWADYEANYLASLPSYRFKSIGFFNLYSEYFAFNLRNQNYFGIFQNETDPDRLNFYWEIYSTMVRPLVEWTHNVFFDYTYLMACEKMGACQDKEAILADAIATLKDMPEPPVAEIHIDCPDLPVDPLSEFFVSLQDLIGIDIGFELKTEQPHETVNRCRREYLWQRTPYHTYCVGFFPQQTYPGLDYLLTYWMGRYYNFIDPVPVDDDDDAADDDDDDVVTDDDDDADDDQAPTDGSDDDDDEGGCCG